MQTVQILDDYKFKNIINCNSNNKCEKKIRTQYSNSKYRDIFFRENNKLKRALNHKYWVAIQLEKLDEEILSLFDVVITRIINDETKEVYKIEKSKDLTIQQLALLCDENNLEYGYKYIEKYNCIMLNKNQL